MGRKRIEVKRLGDGVLVRFDQGYLYSSDSLDTPDELLFELDASTAERVQLFAELVRRREGVMRDLGYVDPTRGIARSFDSFEEYEVWLAERCRELEAKGIKVMVS